MSEIRNLAAGLVHAAMQDGISELGEKECAYFAGHLESMHVAFKCYVNELAKIELSKNALFKNCPVTLTPPQKKAVERECKQIVRELNMKHKQTLNVLEKWLREFDRMNEEAKEFAYNETDK